MFGSVLASTACESTTQVGSACPSGVCPMLGAAEGSACLVSDINVDITGSVEPTGATAVCLPRPLPLDDAGLAACSVEWELAAAADPLSPAGPLHCSDRPFLQPTASGQSGLETCIVPQLSADEYAAGDAQGWFYEHGPSQDCGAVGAIRFTDEAQPIGVASVTYHCSVVLAEDDDGVHTVDPSECASLPASFDTGRVGAACMPIVPEGGFDDQEAYVESGAGECETGTCLVFKLHGDPASDCVPGGEVPCATPEDVQKRVYCSCRCNARGEPGPECDCPDGFTCIDVLQRGPAELRGGYCVRNNTFTGGTSQIQP
jgi:hypothetical protein